MLPNFSEGGHVPVAWEDFTADEKLDLRWSGLRRIVKALSDYVCQVEDLRNGVIEDIHGARSKFDRDGTLNTSAIMSHVLSSETRIPVARLLRFLDEQDGMKVLVRWKVLLNPEDTLEPLARVYEDAPAMLLRLLRHKATPTTLADKARRILAL